MALTMPGGHRVLEPRGRADRVDLLPGQEGRGVRERENVVGDRVDLDDGEVEEPVVADDLGAYPVLGGIGGLDGHMRIAFVLGIDLARDHMVIRKRISGPIDEESRSEDAVGHAESLLDLDSPDPP